MTSRSQQIQHSSTLQRLDGAPHAFETPSKRIDDADTLDFFLSSIAYKDIMIWLLQLNTSMFPFRENSGKIRAWNLLMPLQTSPIISTLQEIASKLDSLLGEAPPDPGPRRYGNVAFRTWYQSAGHHIPSLLDDLIAKHLPQQDTSNGALRDELQAYFLASFGSAQRLDYGTGHELSFLAFLAALWKLGAFTDGDEHVIVLKVIQPYLELVRKLISTYTLEPAGSHGVWGLDDHSFLPYIFGSAQLGPAVTSTTPNAPTEGSLPGAPKPSSITKKDTVADHAGENMYFSAVQFIYDVKRGPFWEHSPILYDISGIKDGWAKINKGMLKMYAAEVLGKFPVVQHFAFGSLFRWEKDPDAIDRPTSVHQQQQPQTQTSHAGSTGGGAETAAPWGKKQTAPPPTAMQASTGVPTTRAPWTMPNVPNRQLPPSESGMPSMRAPWASHESNARSNKSSAESATKAPWAK